MSVTYTTAHGNAGSLTHYVRPGIEPASSWILVGFISAAAQWELRPFDGVCSLLPSRWPDPQNFGNTNLIRAELKGSEF